MMLGGVIFGLAMSFLFGARGWGHAAADFVNAYRERVEEPSK